MAGYALELRQSFWRSFGFRTAVVLALVLAVLAVRYPPRAWWGYVVGLGCVAGLFAMVALEVRCAWIAVDDRQVHVNDLSWGHHVMERDRVAAIRAIGLDWKIVGKTGGALPLRPIWSKEELRALARELDVEVQFVDSSSSRPTPTTSTP